MFFIGFLATIGEFHDSFIRNEDVPNGALDRSPIAVYSGYRGCAKHPPFRSIQERYAELRFFFMTINNPDTKKALFAPIRR